MGGHRFIDRRQTQRTELDTNPATIRVALLDSQRPRGRVVSALGTSACAHSTASQPCRRFPGISLRLNVKPPFSAHVVGVQLIGIEHRFTPELGSGTCPEVGLEAVTTPLSVLQPKVVVHRLAESLLAAEITLSCLNRCVS